MAPGAQGVPRRGSKKRLRLVVGAAHATAMAAISSTAAQRRFGDITQVSSQTGGGETVAAPGAAAPT